MHIKTNIEHSSVQIIVLALCPLLFVVSSMVDAIFFMSGTILCLIVSQIFILIFNKYLNNNVKAMLTALISALIVVVATILVKDMTDKVLPETSYFVIFSTTILNAEFIYFRNKAVTKHYFFSIFKISFIFALLFMVYSVIKEFMAFGTLIEKQLFSFTGFGFCRTMIFNLLLMASLCALFDYIVRVIDKAYETEHMVYQKYVKIIRNEKSFQYDRLRRERLLTNEIEVNRLSKSDSEKLKQKSSENETIEYIQEEIVEAENEEAEVPVETEENNVEKQDESETQETKKRGKKKKKGGK